MHVHLPLWEILALRSMAEGQHEDGAHTWGSLQSSLQAESLSFFRTRTHQGKRTAQAKPGDSQRERGMFREVGVALHSWGVEFGV